tara:strand:- start:696 stop:914 length:219 start_codon:yes stop_codon:yes gene_type:complete
MNKYIKVSVVGAIATVMVGCAVTQGIPSLTVGGAANKKAVLDVSVDKGGLSVTAPLVNLEVPFPSAKRVEEE